MYIIYKTVNNINGKYYIGVHKENRNVYYGSGILIKKALKKYGRKNFTVEIIDRFDNKDDAYAHEAILVNDDIKNDPLSYNLMHGGNKPFGEKNPFHGKKHSKEFCDRMRERLTKINNPGEIQRKFISGKKLTELAKEYDVSKKTIFSCVSKCKECRKILSSNNDNLKVLDKDQIEMVWQYYLDGKNTKWIGKRFGLSHFPIERYLKMNPECMRLAASRRRKKVVLSDGDINQMRSLHSKGLTYEKIAERFGCSGQTVSRRIG